MVEKKTKVTKRHAATNQLETAIKLFLENRDLISAYTLCCAADGILEGIYQNERGGVLGRQHERLVDRHDFRFSWREEWKIRIRPEHRKEVFQLLHEPQNFFKHADKDHDCFYEFKDWKQTGWRIFFAVTNYRLIFGELTSPMNVFFTFYAILHPKVLAKGNPLLDAISANSNCMDLLSTCSQEEAAAIGYLNLKSICPELFVQPEFCGTLSYRHIN